MTLSQRYRNYLLNHDTKWMHKRKLTTLAKSHGYSYEAIQHAFRKLEDMLDVGMNYVSQDTVYAEVAQVKGTYYVGYKMSEEELQHRKEDIEWFNQLP